MVCRYGMSDLGPIDYNYNVEHPYLGRDIQNHREFSEKTAERIDSEVAKIINHCYEKGKKLLTENIDKLELLANKLIEKETLQAKEIYELLNIKPRELYSFKPNE